MTRGVFHAFSGSPETFRELDRLGEWHVGIGGVLTYKNASIAKTITEIPDTRILLETDSPYLSTGNRSEARGMKSSRIPLIAELLAGLKGLSLSELADRTTSNAQKLFRL